MKKKILGLAAIAMSMISFSSLAQTQQSGTCCETSQQCVASQYNCPVAGTTCDIQGKKANPFAGLTHRRLSFSSSRQNVPQNVQPSVPKNVRLAATIASSISKR